MYHSLIGCLLAAVPGVGIAWLNARITSKAAHQGTTTALSLIPVLRMALSVGYLALVYFLAPYTPWDRVWILAGACVGLTLPMFFFTFRLTKQLSKDKRSQNQTNNEGGDT